MDEYTVIVERDEKGEPIVYLQKGTVERTPHNRTSKSISQSAARAMVLRVTHDFAHHGELWHKYNDTLPRSARVENRYADGGMTFSTIDYRSIQDKMFIKANRQSIINALDQIEQAGVLYSCKLPRTGDGTLTVSAQDYLTAARIVQSIDPYFQPQPTFSEFLGHFANVSERGGQYRADCPCCNDTKQHLYITVNQQGGVGLHCHKGCDTQDILSSAGLRQSDLHTVLDGGVAYTYTYTTATKAQIFCW